MEEGTDYPACLAVAQMLIKKYQWALLSEVELAKSLLEASQTASIPVNLEKLAREQYTVALYQACQQSDNLTRCERAYTELFYYLRGVAYQRWPDLAEGLVARALELVHSKIRQCREPAKFLAFASSKLWHAFKEEMRRRAQEARTEPLDIIDEQPNLVSEQEEFQSNLTQQEQLHILWEAIQRGLNELEQKVVVLKFFGGLSTREVGNHLKIEENNVRQLLHRARQKLRQDEQLRRYFFDEEE